MSNNILYAATGYGVFAPGPSSASYVGLALAAGDAIAWNLAYKAA